MIGVVPHDFIDEILALKNVWRGDGEPRFPTKSLVAHVPLAWVGRGPSPSVSTRSHCEVGCLIFFLCVSTTECVFFVSWDLAFTRPQYSARASEFSCAGFVGPVCFLPLFWHLLRHHKE